MVNEIKSYIKSFLSEYKEHKDGFDRDNIASTILDNSYFISYEINTDANGIVMEDNMQLTLEVFKKGYRDPQTALDTAMESVNTIRLNVLSPESIASYNAGLPTEDFQILGVDSVSQVPEPLSDSNNNSIIVTVIFNIKFIQIVC